MKIEKITTGHMPVAAVYSKEYILKDTQSALDLIMSIKYETECDRIALNEEAIAEEFFILSSGVAGEVLQKFINYHVKFAVYGDFTKYTSKPLKDFIYECNNGSDIFFVSDIGSAVERLSAKQRVFWMESGLATCAASPKQGGNALFVPWHT